ncbi:dTDP-4-dehydrorhamnose reductase [uncultured Nitratireductor sp.]|uniref:dTDP-4-dehydrorhamnose reductase n=1 Tax=uncultured Nitratireductor sp. TaxID=520953 RepID=UPI0026091D42|nr:dTDP-4-dehydrorhamnose reductase [uncultured Nitratireductor sp.]
MRIAVTGKSGQVALSLQRLAQEDPDLEVVPVGRPKLDLAVPASVASALQEASPDLIVSAAAYTAVDQAEDERELAYALNSAGAEAVAREAGRLGVPLIHLSTDYVFDGRKDGFYTEADTTRPRSVYGASKLEGEKQVQAVHPRAVILRTAWVYSPYGKNFVKTMLALAETRDEVNVVCDQWGCPTYALEIARGIKAAGQRIKEAGADAVAGTYHFTGSGQASWYDVTEEVFRCSSAYGGPVATVNAIQSSQFPTKAERPRNSRLDCSKFADVFGYRAPDWRLSVKEVVRELVGL